MNILKEKIIGSLNQVKATVAKLNKLNLFCFTKEIFIQLVYFLTFLSLILLFRYFIATPLLISGSSMQNTFFNGDSIILNKLTYKFKEPAFGDIISFENPVDSARKLTGFSCISEHINQLSFRKGLCDKVLYNYIKRVIGIPGDKILIKDGNVYRNGKLLDESSYLNIKNNGKTYIYQNKKKRKEYIVPKNSVFTLGDNRNGSGDSREWSYNGHSVPFVPYENIVGKYGFMIISPNYISKKIKDLLN